MTIELVKILEAAQDHYNRANVWFKLYQDEKEEMYWTACEEEEYAARGLLEAYDILTGNKIYTHEIKEELFSIA